MTYCVGMQINKGLIFMSDTRTNSGVDNISVFKKMFTWEGPDKRFITLMTAGNLATTQAVISHLDDRTNAPKDRKSSISEVPSMFQAAKLVGETLREVISETDEEGQEASTTFNATMILGGQIGESKPTLFMIYPEGNFIEASNETPFFQIGETKYGRPILLRAYDPNMSFEDAVKLLMVSFDSTIKANLSVGLPLDLQIYENDHYKKSKELRFENSDAYYQTISSGWGKALTIAFEALPDFKF